MTEPWIIAVTALFVSVISPVVLSIINAVVAGKRQRADWTRQDIVSERLVKSNEKMAQEGIITNGKLDVIHSLVNSNMTAAMQSELDSMVREVSTLREIVDMKFAQGIPPTKETVDMIVSTDAKIIALKKTLELRALQQKSVDIAQENIRDELAKRQYAALLVKH